MSKAEKHAEICRELNALYARKNADYGDSFGKSYQEYGMTMACIRLEDKLNRLKSLSKQAAQVQDESMEDTLMDLANYAIMTLVERTERKETVAHRAQKCAKIAQTCAKVYPECICHKCVNDESGCCLEEHGGKRHEGCPVAFCPDFEAEGGGE